MYDRFMSQAWEVVWWWERRRIPFNLAVLAAGIVSVLTVLLIGGRLVHPGEDVVEPVALFAGAAVYAFAANACFCLGWITELLWSGGDGFSHCSGQEPCVSRRCLVLGQRDALARGARSSHVGDLRVPARAVG
jgi:hypothetical protein